MYLNTHTYYSLKYGCLSPTDLVEKSFINDIDTLVLTDINNTAAIPEFYFACRKNGVKPVAGVDIRDNNHKQLYILIAKNNHGLLEINLFLSKCSNRQKTYSDLPEFTNTYLIIPYENYKSRKLSENEFIGLRPGQVNSIINLKTFKYYHKMVILHTVSFSDSEDYDFHRHLFAINYNTLLSKLSQSLPSKPSHCIVHPSKLREIYSSHPDIIKNTLNLLDSCGLCFDKSHKNLKIYSESSKNDVNLLRIQSFKGLKQRYGNNYQEGLQRVKHELNIIEKLGFVSYFLITWDIIRFSKSKGFYHVGRGSGANSVVAYCLGITDVDPIELNLYFERFLNPQRSSPPDFDIDYSWRDRDKVLEYIFDKYGTNKVALLGATNTFQQRSLIREFAKVYGIPDNEIKQMCELSISKESDKSLFHKIIKFAIKAENFPNNRTIHAGGVIISNESIYQYTATDIPPKGMPTTQWDMYIAEDLGFEKFDILSQRGLGHIRECIEIVKTNKNIDIDITQVNNFKTDDNIKKTLSKGETLGCFYIESPAMRGLIKKLKCNNYITLVAASSIIRPGVAKSGMMKEYIKRYNSTENIIYPHKVLEEQLSETYGIMVYQEDVLKVCHHYAGMNLAEADMLRRAMSGKFRSKDAFLKIRDKFFDSCNKLARPINTSAEIWRQIESFAGYSFSKAHSASYAVESYQSLFLKTYFPLEFMTAVLNNFGGFYNHYMYLQEAKRLGATIKNPCVNNSNNTNKLIGETIYLGFIYIKSLEKKIIDRIITERNSRGKFISLEDFYFRINPSMQQLSLLIRVGALNFTRKTIPELLWQSYSLKTLTNNNVLHEHKLLYVSPQQYTIPELEISKTVKAYNEIELLGFPLSLSYFDLLKTKFRGEIFADEMITNLNSTVKMLGVFVCVKYIKTSNNNYMIFCTWIDAKGNYFDSLHFPRSLRQYPFRGFGVYLMLGKIIEEYSHPTLNVEKFAKMDFISTNTVSDIN